MKYLKIFMMLAVATLFAACSDDDKWGNPSNATVELGETEIRVKENKGIVNIPIKVVGENHGRIQVTVDVKAADTDGAVEDVNYMITSKTINIAPEDNEGNIEFITVDDDDINDERTFIVTIADVKGATAVAGTQTNVVLRDNDSEFYDKLTGAWTMTVEADDDSHEVETWQVRIVGADDEDDPDYNSKLYVIGMMGYSWTVGELTYEYDQAANKIYLTFEFPQLFAEEVNFGLGGYNDVYLWGVEGQSYSLEPLVGEVSDDFTTVTFDSNGPAVYGRIANADGSYTGYIWFGYFFKSLTR